MKLNAATTLVLVFWGCGPVPPESTPPSHRLGEVVLEQDFDFSTTHQVTLLVSAPPGAFVDNYARVVVTREDGAGLFSGALVGHRPLVLAASLPTKDSIVRVRVEASNFAVTREVAVVDGRAILEL